MGGIKKLGVEEFIGVPDSTLKSFCDYIDSYEKNNVTVNEGAAVGLGIGTYLATGKPACIYLQNSGIGNLVNPLTSLASDEVYSIPMLFVIGWRGEPGIKDEPQHKFMGMITEKMLQLLNIEYSILEKSTTELEIIEMFYKSRRALLLNRQYAFVVKNGTLENKIKIKYENDYKISREIAIKNIVESVSKEDIIVSTTGKISRELYEQLNIVYGNHNQAFLTVGGMGHASMIALGLSRCKTERRVICIDGDGSAFMHMGNMAFIANQNVKNLIHICLNNNAHESVGGIYTGCTNTYLSDVAKSCGYDCIYRIEKENEIKDVFVEINRKKKLVFLEINVSIDSREDLGRPKESAISNKNSFMKYHGFEKD